MYYIGKFIRSASIECVWNMRLELHGLEFGYYLHVLVEAQPRFERKQCS